MYISAIKWSHLIKIDATDKKISDLLLEDGRMSCAQIAKRIGGEISERAVRYRISRLIANGVISVRGNVNAEGIGLPVCADVFIEVEPSQVKTIALQLAAYESVSYIAYATGDTDISIQVFTRDNSAMFEFVTEVIGKITGVRKTHISFVPIKIKDDHVWPIPSSIVKKD
jgi:Lrp/AsnC family transcriptional regulator for asnA, asnC and gidA